MKKARLLSLMLIMATMIFSFSVIAVQSSGDLGEEYLPEDEPLLNEEVPPLPAESKGISEGAINAIVANIIQKALTDTGADRGGFIITIIFPETGKVCAEITGEFGLDWESPSLSEEIGHFHEESEQGEDISATDEYGPRCLFYGCSFVRVFSRYTVLVPTYEYCRYICSQYFNMCVNDLCDNMVEDGPQFDRVNTRHVRQHFSDGWWRCTDPLCNYTAYGAR